MILKAGQQKTIALTPPWSPPPPSYTFQVVHDNTDSIWKFQRYELIKEYHTRPAAPPPLILFSHLYLFVRRALLCRPAPKSSEFSRSTQPTASTMEKLLFCSLSSNISSDYSTWCIPLWRLESDREWVKRER